MNFITPDRLHDAAVIPVACVCVSVVFSKYGRE